MLCNTYIWGWRSESQGFFYQSDQAYGAQVNEIGLGNDNDEYVGGDDFDMQPQPNYLDFF